MENHFCRIGTKYLTKVKATEFLKKHESNAPSLFEENTRWRKENEQWLHWSRNVALSLIDYMQTHDLTRAGLADKLGVSPQYVSKLLSGRVNFSFKNVSEIENKLGISCITVSVPELV